VGEVLFYIGDPAPCLYALLEGKIALSTSTGQTQTVCAPAWLEPLSALGGLPQSHKASALTPCRLESYPVESLLADVAFNAQARAYLAGRAQEAEKRRDELAAPLRYEQGARLPSGGYRFDEALMLFAFCEGARPPLQASLPPALRLLELPMRTSAPVLLVFADFPRAYLESAPEHVFRYQETTFFLPVRYREALGLTVPQIYPSTYEPILLGRELYGFPKRLGETVFSRGGVSLCVDGERQVTLTWAGGEESSERALVGALGAWLGLSGAGTALAFSAGEVLRRALRLPSRRRVDVYNPFFSPFAPPHLTRATFGVLRWYSVARLEAPSLTAEGSLTRDLALRVSSAYRTRLDLRLGKARAVGENSPP